MISSVFECSLFFFLAKTPKTSKEMKEQIKSQLQQIQQETGKITEIDVDFLNPHQYLSY